MEKKLSPIYKWESEESKDFKNYMKRNRQYKKYNLYIEKDEFDFCDYFMKKYRISKGNGQETKILSVINEYKKWKKENENRSVKKNQRNFIN
jgi:hypothetical protein